jgi:hypothetical protein
LGAARVRYEDPQQLDPLVLDLAYHVARLISGILGQKRRAAFRLAALLAFLFSCKHKHWIYADGLRELLRKRLSMDKKKLKMH